MVLNIVIIGQNEGTSILSMCASLQHIAARRVWVLDRCTDNSEQQLAQLGEYYIKTPHTLQGRQTSYARNAGLSHCLLDADVLFLDGDRYIKSGNLNGLQVWDKDIALLKLETDERDNIEDYQQQAYGRFYNGFYSCGVFFKRSAINRIVASQSGELFKTSLQQEWGIEDTALGDVCFSLGLTCDIYPHCRLNGMFEKNCIDSLNTIERRMSEAEKLEGLWW